ncbi:uncharacterized protein LOC131884573 isoform X2 [Tigriopus californicus]|nr:uncharacterized protein LOC131884573 isoform X2 [Tigriopus californicus]
MPETKLLNKWIEQAKCNAILEEQIQEKQRRRQKMQEENRQIDEEVDMERVKAIGMMHNRQLEHDSYKKSIKETLDQQIQEIQARKALEEEEKQKSLIERQQYEEVLKQQLEDEKKVYLSHRQIRKQDLMQSMLDAQARRNENREKAKAIEKKIQMVQEERLLKERSTSRKSVDPLEPSRQKIGALLIQSRKSRETKEEMLLRKQTEENERKFRVETLKNLKAASQRKEAIANELAHQVKAKEQRCAMALMKEQQEREEALKIWNESMKVEEMNEKAVSQLKKEYLMDLQSQLRYEEANKRDQASRKVAETKEIDMDRKNNHEKILQLKEKKLDRLRACNIPEKYVLQVDKKFTELVKKNTVS